MSSKIIVYTTSRGTRTSRLAVLCRCPTWRPGLWRRNIGKRLVASARQGVQSHPRGRACSHILPKPRPLKLSSAPRFSRFSTRKGQARGGQERLLFELVGKTDKEGQRLPIRGCKTNSKGVVVQGNHNRYLFRAASEAEANDWVRSVKYVVPEGESDVGKVAASAHGL